MSYRTSEFRKLTNELLEKRFNDMMNGKETRVVSMKMLFYEFRNEFMKRHGKRDLDIKPINNTNKQLKYFAKMVASWINAKIQRLMDQGVTDSELTSKGFNPGALHFWSVFRDSINITVMQKALVYGSIGEVALASNIYNVINNSDIIILTEKELLGYKLCDAIIRSDFNVNIISTQGSDISKVIEIVALLTIISTINDCRQPRVYFLHDMDVFSMKKLLILKSCFPALKSAGVNQYMLRSCKINPNELVEPCHVRNVTNDNSVNDTLNSLIRTQSLSFKPNVKLLSKNRIDAEALYVARGIKPFVKYLKKIDGLQRIRSSPLWND